MLPCPDRKTLSRYLDGELDGWNREIVEKHLRWCPECRRRLAGLGAPEAVLKSLRPPVRKPGLKCPGDETITAWIEGRLEPGTRKRVASHLVRCPACAARAGMISEDLEAGAAVRSRGLETVPAELEMLTADLLGRRRSLLGRVAVDLKRVLDFPEWWRDRARPEPLPEGLFLESAEFPDRRIASVNETAVSNRFFQGPPPFFSERSEEETCDRWTFREKEITLEVGFGKAGRGAAICLVRVRDESGQPAAGAAVSLEGGAKPILAATDRAGTASLGPVARGEYRLRVDFGPGAEVEIKAR